MREQTAPQAPRGSSVSSCSPNWSEHRLLTVLGKGGHELGEHEEDVVLLPVQPI